jgi:hypothetical protein
MALRGVERRGSHRYRDGCSICVKLEFGVGYALTAPETATDSLPQDPPESRHMPRAAFAEGSQVRTPSAADFRPVGKHPRSDWYVGGGIPWRTDLAGRCPAFAPDSIEHTVEAWSANSDGDFCLHGGQKSTWASNSTGSPLMRAPVTRRACARGASGPAAAAPGSADAWRTRPRPGA